MKPAQGHIRVGSGRIRTRDCSRVLTRPVTWAVLVAIAIPVFTSQLEKSRDATTVANLRSAYAEASAQYLSENKPVGSAIAITGVHIESTDDTYGGEDKLPFTVTGQVAGLVDKTATFTFADNDTVTCAIS